MNRFKDRGENIDSSNKSALECSKCMRNWYKKANMKIPGRNMPGDDFKNLISYFNSVTFCGQISDPTAYPYLINALKICNIKNLACWVRTASSHKNRSWYEKAFAANPNAIWVFGIDGLPNESHKYIINQNGEYLFEIMKLAVKKGIKVWWQYIIFKYNENHIENAKKLAEDNNIVFDPMVSGRWLENNEFDIYKPTKLNNYKEPRKLSNKIYPKCTLTRHPFAYSATGYLLPCCYVDRSYLPIPSQIKLLYKEHLKVKNNKDVKSIINSKEWVEFFKTLQNNPATTCKYVCNKPFTIKEAMTEF